MQKAELNNLRTLDELIKDVEGFFERSSGVSADYSEVVPDGNVTLKPSLQGMSLLEIACLGNAEKTLQGELFFHLRSLNWNVVLEIGYVHESGKKRNPDIGVFDSFGHGKKLICVIELKHYSANQGSANQLTNALNSDYDLDRPDAPLMQIGMFTVVSAISSVQKDCFEKGIYRFLNTYCNGNLPPKNSGDLIFNNWCGDKKWEYGPVIQKTRSISFVENINQRRIDGYIEYVIGIRN